MSTRIRKAAKAATSSTAKKVGASVAPRGLWVEVDPGFHVGNDRRQYLGSITEIPGEGFDAFGPTSDFIGRFDELDEAKEAVIMVAGASAPSISPESLV
ncbi:hypothetical protein HWD99_13745 [Microbacterium sp. C5A9]|uniref:hypothetical protein n=1 Tax=Microbacterium sp. C5A9 TaxID=2736663 RepID=UPI001F51F74A|nr:hypothetical protein [Microbacterium sp. C5A9]MCI1019689.1 hypothetical protein [Microbacterium sp. C5A9]